MEIVNMLESNEQAYVRGQKAATYWKRLKKVVLGWDQRGVTWARNHKVPVWLGHAPTIIVISLPSIILLFSGLMLLAGILTGFAVLLGLSTLFSATNGLELSNENTMPSHCFKDDDYVTNSILNDEYDGAPYKSPGED